ncbi:oligosaccharide amylase [Anaerohalosphaera lusitana]|uniref:Oligosaccharide amylase n=1 Tax=Anaerohalosphaera lusitana TaxID=1936003 RepID=A0A1U9NR87_9BACT|nr:hypothetical protein [Anaerohalosphaera lusitana]AQT70140.1 oligosaccharide amylase [Anaerohalosphaera lusitana]
MWLKWLPWKLFISKAAKRHGFLDPISLWSYFQRFAQPSEVAGPMELVRASAMFHARGLINSRAIPQNSDWVWPWWVHRQFNPAEEAFIPRAFSLTYINLTERNWTAAGLPGYDYLPIVDPTGLVTPHWDGWSIDFWLVDSKGNVMAPSRRREDVQQRLFYGKDIAVATRFSPDGHKLLSTMNVELQDGVPQCAIRLRGSMSEEGYIAASVRPCNSEGISFVHEIAFKDGRTWKINSKDTINFETPADVSLGSKYEQGDVANQLTSKGGQDHVLCDVGMANAAALFKIEPGKQREIKINIPLEPRKHHEKKRITYQANAREDDWGRAVGDYCRVSIPDKRKQYLYENAIRTLLLHATDEEVFPGPFTYKRFWFRDASFILHAMLCANFPKRVESVLATYPDRQMPTGYFLSQQGEWDSNGQALWIIYKYWKMTGRKLSGDMIRAVEKGANWICRKCTSSKGDKAHTGLLPAGFSAEHFGPNDYYYWDDFWAVAGLRSAAEMMEAQNEAELSNKYSQKAAAILKAIDASLEKAHQRLGTRAMPVSCNRRLDSGTVGCMSAGYPCQVFESNDERLLATAEYLVEHCLHKDGFFLDISHSGINAYLTLHIAQVLMQAGDERHGMLADSISRLASSTGQWPEAIHPRTEGGCMGDGQHVWAACEWVLYLRNCLVFEDTSDSELVLGKGIRKDWCREGEKITIGPAPTLWGEVRVAFEFGDDKVTVSLDEDFSGKRPQVVVDIPSYERTYVEEGQKRTVVNKAGT